MSALKGKTLFITGASRGIGKAIAMRAAQDGANIVIAAKSTAEKPGLPGTIYSAAQEVEQAGGRALACVVDIRDEAQVRAAVDRAVETFGGIDILVNNASAIRLSGTLDTPMRAFDLMHQINVRGTFAVSQICIPHLMRAQNPHILTLSPPLNLDPRWFAPCVAYTITKYSMSMMVLGMAAEFRDKGIAVNALWPRTFIATAAVKNLLGGDDSIRRSRKPEIVGDAAYAILTKNSRDYTGNFCVDDDVLKQAGVEDFSQYAVCPGEDLAPDPFL